MREARRAARGKGEPSRYSSLIGPEEVPAMPRRIAQDAPFMVLQSAVRTQGTAIGMPLAGMRSACCNSFQQRRWERLGSFAQDPDDRNDYATSGKTYATLRQTYATLLPTPPGGPGLN